MNRSVAVLTAIVLAATSLPARAALWGMYYLSNDAYGYCGDGRLSPDVRIAACTKAAKRNLPPEYGLQVLDALAGALEDKSDYPGAVLVYTKALSYAKHQQIPEQQYYRGGAYLRQGKFDLANADFSAGISSNYAFSWAGLGEVAAAQGRYKEAIDFFKSAILLNPTDIGLQLGRANIYARMGNYEKAMADSAFVIEEYHNSAFPYGARCWNRAIMNRDLDDAVADCKHALSVLPDEPNELDSLALVLYRQSKWDEAITTYNEALTHNPYMASSLYMRGIAELRKDDAVKGQADIKQAEAIDPRIGTTYATYGITP